MSFTTPDLYDDFGDRCGSCETQFKQYGGRHVFSGRIRTLQCLEDNVLLRRMLETPSDGEVLVVDGSGSLRCALMGDLVAGLGERNGWSGVIIHGAVRDVHALAGLDFGIKALGSNPKKSGKKGTGQMDVSVMFGGATFTPGHWLYSDDNGILVAPEKLT
ncbi:MAG: ribonuclease E activity regulator RraA [Opitutaceae bacterium]|nr:ribonuclease E activity regulator RraA [Opitutaceae bacterium]